MSTVGHCQSLVYLQKKFGSLSQVPSCLKDPLCSLAGIVAHALASQPNWYGGVLMAESLKELSWNVFPDWQDSIIPRPSVEKVLVEQTSGNLGSLVSTKNKTQNVLQLSSKKEDQATPIFQDISVYLYIFGFKKSWFHSQPDVSRRTGCQMCPSSGVVLGVEAMVIASSCKVARQQAVLRVFVCTQITQNTENKWWTKKYVLGSLGLVVFLLSFLLLQRVFLADMFVVWVAMDDEINGRPSCGSQNYSLQSWSYPLQKENSNPAEVVYLGKYHLVVVKKENRTPGIGMIHIII